MVTLRDPFSVVHKKDIKNKSGQVVAQVDYVGWSQSADRLDEAAPDWSFSIMAIGPDWVHGRLTIGDRHFENIGYAENADADWKKEPLKDAASDAFKRCAALAGVARYLYDKDSTPQRAAPPRSAPRPVSPPPDEDELAPEDVDALFNGAKPTNGHASGAGLTFGALMDLAEKRGAGKSAVYQEAEKLFGRGTQVKNLTGQQREQIAYELGLTA